MPGVASLFYIETRDASGRVIRRSRAMLDGPELTRTMQAEMQCASLHNRSRCPSDRSRQLVYKMPVPVARLKVGRGR
ncbi:hypothetical protein [Methylobacterium dankookense]|uniref:Uncharacterized protein n=1 Tax=Methylobacterium dankookense TaxID=560405 RepID=A0A564G3U2_9HYPH|nr:hypothetical protein [Methylobacterium dankookense]GJD58698.1 hypothetical protein IFDJLNFL_4621 [Methylobacterium dankookense]VUF15173.1 hypothetical protein MTDSW087_04908 [Methylobacterium dankookense]